MKTWRNPIQNIEQRYEGLSPTYKAIADFVLQHLEMAAFSSLKEVGKKLGVSDATLIRFARDQGFAGYQDFRKHLVEYIRQIINPLPDLVTVSKEESLQTLETVKNCDISSIEAALDRVNRPNLLKLVKSIAKSLRVFSMGWGFSSLAAEFLVMSLSRLGYDSRALLGERRALIEQVLSLNAQDTLVVFDMVPYSAEVIEAVEYVAGLKKRPVIATVTSDKTARIIASADMTFFSGAYTSSKYGYFSIVPSISFCNAIIAEVINQEPKKAARGMNRFEQIVLTSNTQYTQYDKLSMKRKRKRFSKKPT